MKPKISRTVVVTHEASTEWTIENFVLSRQETGQSMTSPHFFAPGQSEPQWYVMLYPHGRDHFYRESLSAYVCCIHGAHKLIKVMGTIGIASTSDDRAVVYNIDQTLSAVNNPSGIGRHNFIKREYLISRAEHYLPNQRLTIQCRLTYALGDTVTCNDVVEERVDVPPPNMSAQLADLLTSADFADVTLVVQGREIKAHKNILAARSPVFEAMFRNDMLESRSSAVIIDDIDASVFRAMLTHVYTDDSHVEAAMAAEMLAAANKYQLGRLQAICEDTLARGVTVDNAIDTYELADRYGATQLQRCVEEFVRAHVGEVTSSDVWRAQLKRTHPALTVVLDALTSLAPPAVKKPKLVE